MVSFGGAAAEAVRAGVSRLVADQVASRLFAQDHTLWGPDAEAEAGNRLSWVGLARSSRALIGEVAALRSALDEVPGGPLDHVVLAGMGGSSLAPEVICATAGRPLVVLDSSDPDVVRAAVADRLDRTVVVVSSKSGGTVETDSQRRAYRTAFEAAGLDPAPRIVVITDPGSPLEATARADGHRVVLADPRVGGRYSALTAFGLVPSGLAGADIKALLDDAQAVTELLARDDDANPALVLGAALAGSSPDQHRRDKLVLADAGSGIAGFADWAEQLIAESTGKQGTGVLPVVVEDTDPPEVAGPAGLADDTLLVTLVPGGVKEATAQELGATAGAWVRVAGPLGAQLLLWEAAVAVAGRLLGINPFDQPDVERAKQAARTMLSGAQVSEAQAPGVQAPGVQAPGVQGDGSAEDGHELHGATAVPGFVDGGTEGGIEIHATQGLLDVATDPATTRGVLPDVVAALLARLDPDQGYLAVMAYLDRNRQSDLTAVRRSLAARTGRPVTFGWGPRFLHSTGQYHKGGPSTGVYLQVTGRPTQDLDVPGQPFSFGQLIAAQAAGDAQVLAERGRPVLRLHLSDRQDGVRQLLEVLR
ncbi:MAG: glucose-6-phosphate isomerase [Angustibacter sp.]